MWDIGLLFVCIMSFHTFRSQSMLWELLVLNDSVCTHVWCLGLHYMQLFCPVQGKQETAWGKSVPPLCFPSCLQHLSSPILILLAGKLLMQRKLSSFENDKSFSSARKCCIAFMESWYGWHYDHELAFQLWPFTKAVLKLQIWLVLLQQLQYDKKLTCWMINVNKHIVTNHWGLSIRQTIFTWARCVVFTFEQ